MLRRRDGQPLGGEKPEKGKKFSLPALISGRKSKKGKRRTRRSGSDGGVIITVK